MKTYVITLLLLLTHNFSHAATDLINHETMTSDAKGTAQGLIIIIALTCALGFAFYFFIMLPARKETEKENEQQENL